nr:shikimate kinase [Candidatus Sigynarchaeota archaeon]
MAVMKNICLVGFMGTGKTKAGRIVAAKLGKKFVETDELIEKAAKKSIPKIFSEDGEIRFREIEIATIKAASTIENAVFSLGGGAVLNSINIMYMRRGAVIICLSARPDIIHQRIIADGKENRPLLAKPDPKAEIERLLALRAPFYVSATSLLIDTSSMTPDEVAIAIIDMYEKHKLIKE